MTETGRIHIGTSGWHYDDWTGSFYPGDLSAAGRLSYYALRFDTVEINNTFYRLPDEETLRAWRETAPQGFVFAVKASRYITHMKKLTDPEGTLPSFLERVELLGDRLGPLLFQLPPHWRANPGRLAAFLEVLSTGHRCAFEFRDPSWYIPQVYRILKDHNAAFCIYHLAGHQSPLAVTTDFVYFRLHGPGAAYEGSYGDEVLIRWAERIREWALDGRDVACYFDNDQSGYAPRDAARLRDAVEH
jgi:uncharacterized protein YecE (DUF72 family)